MVNPRYLEKTALIDPSDNPIRWTSKYGSITFNKVGRDLPFGGINEEGLVVEQMRLDCTVYPSKDGRNAISACQWIQFQLDNYSSVEQVMSSDTLLRIVDATSKFHFLVCDRFGTSVVVEFLEGKMVCHTSKDFPVQALANNRYDESLNCYKNNGDTRSNLSLYNCCTSARQIEHPDTSVDDSTIGYTLRVLNSVSQGVSTKWSIAYDITNMKIYFKCFETPTIIGKQKIFAKKARDAKIKILDFKGIDFNCSDAAKALDLDCPNENSLNEHLVNYSTSLNKEFVVKAFTFYKGWGVPVALKDEEMEYLAKYPESFKCVPK